MNIVWSPLAIEHLPHLRSYIARENPKAANRIAGTLLDAVERLAELPLVAMAHGICAFVNAPSSARALGRGRTARELPPPTQLARLKELIGQDLPTFLKTAGAVSSDVR